MKACSWKPPPRNMLAATLFVVALAGGLQAPTCAADDSQDTLALMELSSRWVAGVAEKSPAVIALISANAASYYANLRDLALHGPMVAIDALHPVDQLQTMFLRLTVPAEHLASMSGEDVLLHAVREGWIGQDLRHSDELREVEISGNTAVGRLFKFGLDDRPDRGRQYFSRENGRWRVQLRGERERLQKDFHSFTQRSGLSESEAAFFILETRLLRKIVPADFLAPAAASTDIPPDGSSASENLAPIRARTLVTVRQAPGYPELDAATIADTERSLRFVVAVGDLLGDGTGYRLERVTRDRVWLIRGDERIALTLNSDGPSLTHLRANGGRSVAEGSLFDHANLGKDRPGMMSQWRNTGLRGRPQLLQQGSLIPQIAPDGEGIAGLRVGRVLAGSFWDQMGLSQGDVIEEANGSKIDSMMRWREFMDSAENSQAISLLVARRGQSIPLLIQTIPAARTGPAD